MAVDLLRLLLLCWLLTWKSAFVSAGDCTEPFPVANAYRKWEGGADTTWVNYTCLAGYDHTGGSLSRQCQGGGYSGTAPTCLLNCGPPLNYTHSWTSSTSSLSGVRVSYTCLGTTNHTKDSNQMYCDPAVGRWESPVYCAEKETLLDSIHFLPLSSKDSSLLSANDESTSSDDAANYISITSNNIVITTSNTATMAYTLLSTVHPTISALTPTAAGSLHSTLSSVETGHTVSLLNDGSSSYDRSLYDTSLVTNDVSSVYSSSTVSPSVLALDSSSVYFSSSSDVISVYSLSTDVSSVYSSSSDLSSVYSSSSDLSSVYSSLSILNSGTSLYVSSGDLHPTSSDLSSLNPTSSDLSSFNPTSSDLSSLYPTSSDLSSLNPTSSDLSSLNPTSSDLSSLNPTSSDLSSLNPTSSDPSSLNPTSSVVYSPDLTSVSAVYFSSDSHSVHQTSPVSASTSTPSTEHLSLQPSMSGISIPMTSLTTDVILTPSNQLTVDSSTGVHTNINVSSTLDVSMSSETCPRQDRLVVNLNGGPYEILHVAIIRPSEEDLYNFRLDVYSPRQTCDTASRLPWENRTIVDCDAERLFPIGNQFIIRGSNPDKKTIRICDVEVYGRQPSVDCGVPRPFPGRRVVFTNASLDSTAIYYCDHGYHFRGGPQRVKCSLTGYWVNYGLYCSDKEKIEPNVTTVNAASEWTDNDIGTCSPVNGTALDLAFDLGGKYEIKMVTITTQANTSAASLTMTISRDGLNKTCSVTSGSSYVHETGEITVAIPCNTAPVGDHLDLFITGLTGDLCEVKVFGRPYTGEGVECRQSTKGVEFKGNVNITVNGLPCLPWVTDASLQLEQFPDMTWDEASNYCRNPNGRSKPWCYVDPSKNWEECPIVLCDSICRRYQDGSTYKGEVRTTETGNTCIRWNSGDVPFKRTALYPGGYVSMGNCRNPISSMTRPWCYTNTSPLQHDFCNIPSCPKASEYVTEYHLLDHHGVLLEADESNFTECFIWKKKQNSAIRLSKGNDIESHVLESCGKTYSSNMTLLCSIPTEHGARWVYSILECVNCGMPSAPPGMTVTYTSTYFSAVATYACASGYVRDSGAGNFSCLGTGTWDNATLVCIVDCGPPDEVVGASLNYTQTVLGSTAYHHCLVTNETTNVTCRSSGTWETPAWLVECLVDCGSPPTLTFMNVTYNTTLSGSTAMYTCVPGYVAAGGSGNVLCQSSGTWTSITLNCVVDCGSPATQTFMNVTYNTTLSGSTAMYTCVPGYVAAGGSGNVLCQSSGTWTSITLNCVEMSDTPSSSETSSLSSSSSLSISYPSPSSWPSTVQSPYSLGTLSPTSSLSSLTSYYSPTFSSSPSATSLSSLTSYYSFTFSSSPSATLSSSSPSVILAATSSSPPYLVSPSSASLLPSSTTSTPPLSSQLSTSVASSQLYASSSSWSSGITSPSSTARTVTSTCLPLCFCGANNLNSVQLEEIKSKIRVELLLDKNTLSKEKRKLVSAPDSRPSSQAIGHSAWMMLVFVLGVLLLTDVISMVKGVVRVVQRVKRGKFAARF